MHQPDAIVAVGPLGHSTSTLGGGGGGELALGYWQPFPPDLKDRLGTCLILKVLYLIIPYLTLPYNRYEYFESLAPAIIRLGLNSMSIFMFPNPSLKEKKKEGTLTTFNLTTEAQKSLQIDPLFLSNEY